MGLTIGTAKNLLRQIVGGSGFTTATSYLALSSTKPNPSGEGEGGYNITEPSSETSYNRVPLSGHFTDDATGEFIDDTYVVSIKNSDEIHFPEALQNWGTYKYFAIFEVQKNGTPKYVGELLKFTKDDTVNDQSSYEAAVATGLYLKVTVSGVEDYVLIDLQTYPTYDETKTYYVKDDSGITIEEGTVPLVRKGYLKISVQ